MGTSNWQNISYNIKLIRNINPQTVLDIGVGFGRWGILMREFLEIWDDSNYKGEWKRTIDGVEIFSGYIKEYHKYFYSNIYEEDALSFIKRCENKYDLINIGDVIEHLEKKDGEEFIKLALEKSNFVLINIPIGKYWEQRGTLENPHEEHKSIWYNDDFAKFKHRYIKSFNDNTLRSFSVVLLSKNKLIFEKRFGRFFTIKNILKHKLALRKVIEYYEQRKRAR